MNGEPVVCLHKDALYIHHNDQDVVVSRAIAVEIADWYSLTPKWYNSEFWFWATLFLTSTLLTIGIKLFLSN